MALQESTDSPEAAMSGRAQAFPEDTGDGVLHILRGPSGWPRDRRSIMAAERTVAMGLALSWPAISGAEPWMGSYMPRLVSPQRGRRQEADGAGDLGSLVGEDVAEHVGGHSHVKLPGVFYELHGSVVHQHIGERHVGISRPKLMHGHRARGGSSPGRSLCRC